MRPSRSCARKTALLKKTRAARNRLLMAERAKAFKPYTEAQVARFYENAERSGMVGSVAGFFEESAKCSEEEEEDLHYESEDEILALEADEAQHADFVTD